MNSIPTALIIDDEIDLGLLLKKYFKKKGYEVYISQTLEHAKFILHQAKPEIICLDNNLPDGFGWEFAPEIAARSPETIILFISAFHPVVPLMPKNSVYYTLEKPISFKDLDKLLNGEQSFATRANA